MLHQMLVGKLTLLSADCFGSGAVVGSSEIVADSSGAAWTARSAARNVTTATPKNNIALNTMSHIVRVFVRLFCITHHSESDCCTSAVGAIPCGEPQVCSGGRLPIRTTYDVASAIVRTQRVGNRRGIRIRQAVWIR